MVGMCLFFKSKEFQSYILINPYDIPEQVSSVNISFSYFYAGVNLNISVHSLVPVSLKIVLQDLLIEAFT